MRLRSARYVHRVVADLIGVAVVLVALAVAGLISWRLHPDARGARALARARPRAVSEISGPADGLAVRGRVECEAPIEAPSGARCVAFRTGIARPLPRPGAEGAGPRWQQVAWAGRAVPFSVDDGTGRIRVPVDVGDDDLRTELTERIVPAAELTPAEAELLERGEAPGPNEIAARALAAGDEVRVRERLIRPGDAIVLIGAVRRGADGELEIGAGSGAPLRVGPSDR